MDLAVENRDLRKAIGELAAERKELEQRMAKERSTVAEMMRIQDRMIVLRDKLKELEKTRDLAKTDAELQKTAENLKKEIEEEKRLLALLEKKIKDNAALLADLDALRKLEATLRKSRDVEQKETRHIQDEIARLKALLDATPVLEVPPPAEVTIPRSRPVPKNADVYYALAFNERDHLMDPFTPLKVFKKEFERHKREWEHQRIKRPGHDRYIYDPVKIMAHFKGFDFGNARGQSVTLGHNPISTRLHIDIRPDGKKGGTPTGELAKLGMKAPFSKAMDHLTQKRDAVIMFWVNPNSFNTYLVARRTADQAGLRVQFNAFIARRATKEALPLR